MKALALSGALSGAGDWDWPVAVAVALLGGAISGYFTNIGVWISLGIGLLAYVQWLFIAASIKVSMDYLEELYQPFSQFVILSVFSILGLVLGGNIAWWLRLSGVS